MLYACSAYNPANYIKAFQSFAEKDFDIEFGTRPKSGCKCIVLCDVVSRIPEDVQWVLHNLGLDGKNITLLITFIYQFFVNVPYSILLKVLYVTSSICIDNRAIIKNK